jgi:hypothetical protein
MLARMQGEKGSSYTVSGNANYNYHYENQYEDSSKKLKKIDLPNDPAIPLLGIYLEECKST